MKLYSFDPVTGKYTGSHEAKLDEWQTEIAGRECYFGEANAVWEAPPEKEGFTAYMRNGEWTLVADPTLDELKAEKHEQAGAAFAAKRDAIRYVEITDGNTYGFDTANEDITNFMASWRAAEMTGSTPYKVWLADGGKGMVMLTPDDFTAVFNAVRTAQLEAYAWYGEVDAQIKAATTKEEVEAVTLT